MSATRQRVRDYVITHPGVHFNDLVRGLDLAPGQVQYHLRKLQGHESVVKQPLYGRTHYYPPDYGPWERGALAVLRRETARDVLLVLLSDGPQPPNAVADRLDLARSTVEWHLDHLVEQNLVDKRRDEHNHVTLVVTQPEATTALLRLVDPSLANRLVDRFTRLVDDLLSGRAPPR